MKVSPLGLGKQPQRYTFFLNICVCVPVCNCFKLSVGNVRFYCPTILSYCLSTPSLDQNHRDPPFPPLIPPSGSSQNTRLSSLCYRAASLQLPVLRLPRWSRIRLPGRRFGFDPWAGKIAWRRKWPPTPVFLPGESHGQRSLVGSSPRG